MYDDYGKSLYTLINWLTVSENNYVVSLRTII